MIDLFFFIDLLLLLYKLPVAAHQHPKSVPLCRFLKLKIQPPMAVLPETFPMALLRFESLRTTHPPRAPLAVIHCAPPPGFGGCGSCLSTQSDVQGQGRAGLVPAG